jgi:uncharacterized membrane protein
MSYTLLIFDFLLFSFLGWIIESTFCSISQKRFFNAGYFTEMPCSFIFGFGGVILYFLVQYLYSYPWYIVILLGTLAMILVEYIGGILCISLLSERLWDYSKNKYNLHGHIDMFHSFCWLLITCLFYFYLFPIFVSINTFLASTISIPKPLDEIILILFILIGIFLTATRRHHRLQKKKRRKK